MKEINRKKVFIFCYDRYASGGPEALHQLRYYMERVGIDAYMLYFKKHTRDVVISERYLQYFPNGLKYVGELDYRETKEDLLIFPESNSFRLFKYRKAHRAIWWLSVWNYDGIRIYHDPGKCNNTLSKIISKIRCKIINIIRNAKSQLLYSLYSTQNYCGSKFAYEYVSNVKKQTCRYLIEPISKDFLDDGGVLRHNNTAERKNCVLYNPAKFSEILKKLLERGEFEYIPLKGYTPQELIKIYLGAKLYIDFGGFPGPERIPKETVYNGCNILVGKQGAAVNDFDVAIPDEYKLETRDIEEIEKKIEDMLDNYDVQYHDFDAFRWKIQNLEKNFIKQIKENFSDYINDNGKNLYK